MKATFTLFFFLLTILSCTRQQRQIQLNTFAPTVVETKGYIVPKDSTTEPKVKLEIENNPKNIIAGKPVLQITNINVFPAKMPGVVAAGTPTVCVPGKGGFSLPVVIQAKDSPFASGIPQIVMAKDAISKEQNPQNFSSFGKLQGLLDVSVGSLVQDRFGNIWFTNGGDDGVTKYDGKNFLRLSAKQGLQHVVSCILEDRAGNMWFGSSYSGAVKYDGKNFTYYDGAAGFTDQRINALAEDRSGNIWFGTNGNGAIKYDGKTFTYYRDNQGLLDSFVSCILPDRSGNVWFGTSKGASKYDGKSFTNFSEKEGLPKNDIVSMMEDRSGNIWFGTSGKGIARYDGKSFIDFTEKEGLSGNDVRCILQDRSGNFWFGTNGNGLSKYDGLNFTHFTENEGLTSNSIVNMLEDKYGNLWIATETGGLCKYNGKLFTHFTPKEGLAVGQGIYSIFKDRSGNVWFGSDGKGASKYDGKSFQNFSKKEGLSNDVISMAQDKSGNIWFGTTSGFVKFDGKTFTHYTDNDGMFNGFVFGMLSDRAGNMWFGTAGGGVSKFDGKYFTKYTPDQGMFDNFIRCIAEDKLGNIWFGTNNGAIKFDGKIFTNFTRQQGFPVNTVTSICSDSSGNIWFASFAGIIKYDGNTFTSLTEQQGLASNAVWSIITDRYGNIWAGTEGGLSKLTKGKQALLVEKIKSNTIGEGDVFFKNYGYEDGFLGISILSLGEDSKGTIWAGTHNRLTAYHPSPEAEAADTSAPDVQVTNIQMYNENIPWVDLLTPSNKTENKVILKDTSFLLSNGVKIRKFTLDGLTNWYYLPEHLSLAYNNNFLTFNFIGITMNQPGNVKYQYKLEGIDKNWSGLNSSTMAPYGNLSQGTYTFKVKAMNSEGYWSKEYDYMFIVRPPWWKTWWAYTLYVLAIIGSIWYYIKWRERALKERQKMLEKTVQQRTAELAKEKKLSDDLLLNILPSEVAEELKQKGTAEAKQFNEVTVMFTDFKDFTQVSEKLTPTELVAEIHNFFEAFDNIINRYNIEKIKTIGDSYMCAGGLPVPNKTNASDVVSAALEVLQFTKERLQQKMQEGKVSLEIRIGIHTGQVVAGIVGIKKFAYDIWGDTVNIASRMESSGEPGKVNISGSTYELVKDKFNCLYRGKIEAKHKGIIDMYFVERAI